MTNISNEPKVGMCKHCTTWIFRSNDFVKFSLFYGSEKPSVPPETVADVLFHKACFLHIAGEDYFAELESERVVLCSKCKRRPLRPTRDDRCDHCPRPGQGCVEIGCNEIRIQKGYYCEGHELKR